VPHLHRAFAVKVGSDRYRSSIERHHTLRRNAPDSTSSPAGVTVKVGSDRYRSSMERHHTLRRNAPNLSSSPAGVTPFRHRGVLCGGNAVGRGAWPDDPLHLLVVCQPRHLKTQDRRMATTGAQLFMPGTVQSGRSDKSKPILSCPVHESFSSQGRSSSNARRTPSPLMCTGRYMGALRNIFPSSSSQPPPPPRLRF